jgi:hypothetical protein
MVIFAGRRGNPLIMGTSIDFLKPPLRARIPGRDRDD